MIKIGKSIAPQANTPTGMASSVLLSALGKQRELQRTAPATDNSFLLPTLTSQVSPELLSVVSHPELNQGMDSARRKKTQPTKPSFTGQVP